MSRRQSADGPKWMVRHAYYCYGQTRIQTVCYLTGNPIFVPRVLDVEKGQLSYVIGTVYMDMPLKPNVLDDIARDVSLLSLW